MALRPARSATTTRTCPSGTSRPAATSTRRPASSCPTWDDALDAIGADDEPLHVARFGPKFDAQGVLAGSRDSARCIGYLTKYLTKQSPTATRPDRRPAEHAERLADALRYEPCSPTCANWLRYGVQPQAPRARACAPAGAPARPTAGSTSATPGAASWSPANGPARPSPTTAPTAKPGSCETLGLTEPDPARYTWEPVTPGDPDHMPPAQRLLHVVADRQRWHAALAMARARASGQAPDPRSFGNRGGSVRTSGMPRRAKAEPEDELLTVAQMCAELAWTRWTFSTAGARSALARSASRSPTASCAPGAATFQPGSNHCAKEPHEVPQGPVLADPA